MKLKIGLKQERALLGLKVQHLNEDVQELRADQIKLLRDRKRLEWIIANLGIMAGWYEGANGTPTRRDIDRLMKEEGK